MPTRIGVSMGDVVEAGMGGAPCESQSYHAAMRLIDVHVHYPSRLGRSEPGAARGVVAPEEQRRVEDELLETERGLGAVRVCVNSAAGPEPVARLRSAPTPTPAPTLRLDAPAHDAVQSLFERHDDVVGF